MTYQLELKQALKKLEDIELALNESSIVAITDNRGIIQFANDKFSEISKYSKDELVGSRQSIVNSGYHDRGFFKDMWRTIGRGNVWKGEIKNQAKDGSYYWVDTTIVPFLNEKNRPYQYIAIRHDITKRKKYEEEIEQMAYYDRLTMLPNRNYFSKWVDERRKVDHHFTVLFLDLDRFKSINDNYGHHVGDMVLKETARRLQEVLRKSDFISRQGGDEFIITLHGLIEKTDILTVVDKIKEQLALPFYVDGNEIMLTASIGVSQATIEETDDPKDLFELLLKQADTAMYKAKEHGGNAYNFNTPTQNLEMERYYDLEREIVGALERNEFYLVYQPLVELNHNQMVGVEALLRWENPHLGTVSPGEFIPLLEEMGLMIPVGRWIIQSVCRQLKTWHDRGLSIKKVSINVSPVQFRNNDFIHFLKRTLEEEKINPKWLELEITEGMILNIKENLPILNKLRELGVSVSIDDFGTGYSSLSYLKNLPIDTLKIDQSFIKELKQFNNDVVVETIIYLGKKLGYQVLVEGVETHEQLTYLKQHDQLVGQGYYWSKPIRGEAIEERWG